MTLFRKKEDQKADVGQTSEVKQQTVPKLDEQAGTTLVVAQVPNSENICKNEQAELTHTESESLNELIDKLNKYIGSTSVPDCESKINRLKTILNLLDSDGQQKEE